MKLVNRRSVFGFLLFASLSVFQPTSAVSVAQEPVAIEKTVPPGFLPPWACDWSVTCKDENGKIITTSGTVSGEYEEVEIIAGTDAELWASINCYGPPTIDIGAPYRTSEKNISAFQEPANPSSSMHICSGVEEWSVKFRCTGKNGGAYSKTSTGRTYCEALAKARAIVCEKINSKTFGGACRCCRIVVKKPVCYQSCVPRKKR